MTTLRMYSVSVTVDDIEGESPSDAAERFWSTIQSWPVDAVSIDVTDSETNARHVVEVAHEVRARA